MARIISCIALVTLCSNISYAQINDSTTAFELENIKVLSDELKYSRDSVNMEAIYHKTFEDANRKIDASMISPTPGTIGVILMGAISNAARRISGQHEKDKRFNNSYRSTQSEKYISLRYNMGLVERITKLKGDTAAVFIRTYPMEEKFARTASDLEMKMWVRYNYKQWLLKPNLSAIDSLQKIKQ